MSLMERRQSRTLRVLPSRALQYLPATSLVLDAILVLTVCSLSVALRREWAMFPDGSVERLGAAVPAIVALWLGAIWMSGGYGRSVFDAGMDEFRRVSRASLATAGLVGVISFLLRFPLSRGFFFLTFVLGPPVLLLGRLVLRRLVQRARRHGSLSHSVLLVGHPHSVDDVARVLSRESSLGYRVVGALCPEPLTPETDAGVPVVGSSDAVIEQVAATGADVVFFADGGVSSSRQMRRIAWQLEGTDVQVVVAPSVSDVSAERVRIRPVGGLPLIHIDPPRVTDAARWGKRTFDVLGSSLGLLLLAPLLCLVALRVRFADPGPVLFRQTRVGRDGREFPLLKFRTMVSDAEERLGELQREHGYTEGLFKLKDDPRVTKPGKRLRRFSIDELPQLVNVLRGDMSLIGPRPPLPTEVASYDDQTARRLRVRPGLTGLWQVSGRSDLSWDEAVRLDLFYVDNWSVLQDLQILLRTVRAVVGRRGAY